MRMRLLRNVALLVVSAIVLAGSPSRAASMMPDNVQCLQDEVHFYEYPTEAACEADEMYCALACDLCFGGGEWYDDYECYYHLGDYHGFCDCGDVIPVD